MEPSTDERFLPPRAAFHSDAEVLTLGMPAGTLGGATASGSPHPANEGCRDSLETVPAARVEAPRRAPCRRVC